MQAKNRKHYTTLLDGWKQVLEVRDDVEESFAGTLANGSATVEEFYYATICSAGTEAFGGH